MKLGDIPFDQIESGTKVISVIGNPGRVTKIHKNPHYKDWDQDGWMVRIKWKSGQETDYVHWWMLGDVTVAEKEPERED